MYPRAFCTKRTITDVLVTFSVERGAVDDVTAGNGHGRLRRIAPAVAVVHVPAGACDMEVVLLGRLVVYRDDSAGRGATERILSGRVGIPAGAQDWHVHLVPAVSALNTIQRAVEVGVQGPNEAVCGDARGTSGSKAIAGQRRCCS